MATGPETGYFGGKGGAGVFQAIIAAMPPHDHYYEPFLGSGQIMRRKPQAQVNIGWEMDAAAAQAFRDSGPDYCDTYEGDGLKLIERAQGSIHDILIYCDPPYPLQTRTSAKRYNYDWGDAQHLAFLDLVRSHSAKIMISTYPNKMYEKALEGWRFIDFRGPTRGGWRTERLYMNFEGGQSYAGAYAGENHTRRQNIKRKAKRWAAMYSACSAGERAALFEAILTAEAKLQEQ